ncbi:MAG: tetratricopeptide repeat protein [Azoarcus sp.]|jgi:predicted negative regulator of RcsB-dependent stress response|nr:tetratricopeptide repeat protein [Azoarcus sp.]
MAVYDLEEQEQLSQIKAWWERYGNLVATVLLTVAVISVGWQGWRWHQNRVAGEAGELFFELQQAVATSDAQKARDVAGRLISDYSATLQAQMGALLSAGAQFRKDEFDNARVQLEWAATEGRDPVLRELARLRLAGVLLQKGETDAALSHLQPLPESPYRARFEDLRGDVLAVQGKAVEARAAWQNAIDTLEGKDDENAALREVIRAKLETLRG